MGVDLPLFRGTLASNVNVEKYLEVFALSGKKYCKIISKSVTIWISISFMCFSVIFMIQSKAYEHKEPHLMLNNL